jgi:penicillin-binding protein 1B
LLLLGFVGGFTTARTVAGLDRIVRARFEGRLFRVPSRVLSAPTILYPGLDWKRIDLRGNLTRLGYREAETGDLRPGQYRWSGSKIRMSLRPFEHPSRAEPARDITLRLTGSRIDRMRDARSGRELGAVLLEPEPVGAYYGPDREQRELVRLEELPPHLIDSVLAVEDQRFHSHHGLDLRRIFGALWVNLQAGGIRQGGSTLTQQLVKNFFLTPERSLRRKLQEAVMALLVEARYEKEAILESYLNEIYLGQRGSTAIHGVGEAARLYFGKSARNLGLAESALLAAIIQSPNGISPYRDPEAATKRRNLVLALMQRQGRIDDVALEAARAQPLGLAPVTPEPREARYFLDALRRQLPDFYGPDVLTSAGLRIYSTLDLRLQRIAARSLREGLAELERRHPALGEEDPLRALQGCVVALRPQTGEVLALVGGRDYGESQFDRCVQARRPAGSVFKPFVYIAALEPVPGGPVLTLARRLDDSPLSVSTPAGVWRPANYDNEFHGRVTVREAVERSLNVATARLGQEVGIARVAEVARRLGIESPLPPVPSLAIGSADLAPIELARAYATIANGGIRPQIRTFEDLVGSEGSTLERRPVAFQRVLDAGTAYLATSILEGVVQRGTGRGLRAAGLSGPIAAKTGTSDEERDAWFVGFTPELVVVVWVGFDEPRSLGLSASRAALPIWARFLREATGGRVRGAFLPPSQVVRIEIEPTSGARALVTCPEREPEYFLRGAEPEEICPQGAYFGGDQKRRQRDGKQQGILGRLFDAWMREPL